jgi:hypothetical protein
MEEVEDTLFRRKSLTPDSHAADRARQEHLDALNDFPPGHFDEPDSDSEAIRSLNTGVDTVGGLFGAFLGGEEGTPLSETFPLRRIVLVSPDANHDGPPPLPLSDLIRSPDAQSHLDPYAAGRNSTPLQSVGVAQGGGVNGPGAGLLPPPSGSEPLLELEKESLEELSIRLEDISREIEEALQNDDEPAHLAAEQRLSNVRHAYDVAFRRRALKGKAKVVAPGQQIPLPVPTPAPQPLPAPRPTIGPPTNNALPADIGIPGSNDVSDDSAVPAKDAPTKRIKKSLTALQRKEVNSLMAGVEHQVHGLANAWGVDPKAIFSVICAVPKMNASRNPFNDFQKVASILYPQLDITGCKFILLGDGVMYKVADDVA